MQKFRKNQTGFGHIELLVVIVLLAAIGFTAWRVFTADSREQASVSNEDESSIVDELPTDLSGIKPIAEIQALAEGSSSGVSIVGIELESEGGRVLYVVHLSDGTVLAFDALSGEGVVYSDDDDDSMDDNEFIPAGFVAGITIQEAIDITKKERPNSTLEKVELEFEDGRVVYSVRFTDDSRVDVDAADGSIERLRDQNGNDLINSDDDDSYDDSDDDNDETKVQATISSIEARSIAASLHNSPIKKVELENEDDKATYKIEFEDGSKVEIDATTGMVVKSEIKDESS